MSSTADRLDAFRKLDFPYTLKALETYLGAAGFLRHLLLYYAQACQPLQERKTELLRQGRLSGRVTDKNPNKRAAYCRTTTYDPTNIERASFKAVQDLICTETTLYHQDPDLPLFLQVDSSLERGFGVMVFYLADNYKWHPGELIPSTKVRPVMYLSRCLSSPETRYGPSELEVGCLVWAAKKLRVVLQSANQPVIVLTDHAATKGIVDQTSLSTTSTDRANKRLVNASIYLSQYGLNVYHLPGKFNFVPDALSRLRAVVDAANPTDPIQRSDEHPVLDEVWHTSSEAMMNEDLKLKFQKGYTTDRTYKGVLDDLLGALKEPDSTEWSYRFSQDASRDGYPFEVLNGLLYNADRYGSKKLCVPKACFPDVFAVAHDEKHHFGETRMLHELEPYCIHQKTRWVKQWVRHCPTCRLVQTERAKLAGSYTLIREDPTPMSTISVDFIVGLPSTPAADTTWKMPDHDKFDSLLTVTCHSTKRTLLIPGNAKYSAQEWATILARMFHVADWGYPKRIISDRDAKFTSDFWKGFWKACGTRLMFTAAWHPQANGSAERKNQTTEIALRYWAFEHPESNWLDIIPSLQWNLNSAYSDTTKSSAYEQLFGIKLQGPLDIVTTIDSPDIEQITELRPYLRQDAVLAMDFAIARAKRIYDAKYKAIEYSVGDEVYIRLHHGYNLPGKPGRKFSQQRSGLFKIIKRIGRLVYELDLPKEMRIHPVLSVEYLSPAPDGSDPWDRRTPPPGPIIDDQHTLEDDTYETEIIMNHRAKKNGFDYLVKWKGYNHESNTWKNEKALGGSQELIEEYWQRKGGKPDEAKSTNQIKRPRGRPRKQADDEHQGQQAPQVQLKRGRGRPKRSA